MGSDVGRFSGMVLRDVRRQAKRGPVEEMFLLAFSTEYVDDVVSRATAWGVHQFADEAKLGPAVVYRRPFVPDMTWDAEQYLRGGRVTAADKAAAVESAEVDISHVTAMCDDDFWHVIEVGSGQPKRKALSMITAALVSQGEDRVKAFAQTLARHLFDLDTPELLEVGRKMPGRVVLSGDAGLYLRCAIVLDGRAHYERALVDPSASWTRGESCEAEQLLSVCDTAMRRLLRREIWLRTSPSHETGSNERAWADQVSKPDERPRWTPEEHRAFVLESLRWSAEAFGADLATGPWYQYENQSDWFACRFIVSFGVAREELVLLFRISLLPDWTASTPAQVEEEGNRLARAFAANLGGTVEGPVELNNLGMHPREGCVLIHIERQFTGSVADYLEKYGLTEGMIFAG